MEQMEQVVVTQDITKEKENRSLYTSLLALFFSDLVFLFLFFVVEDFAFKIHANYAPENFFGSLLIFNFCYATLLLLKKKSVTFPNIYSNFKALLILLIASTPLLQVTFRIIIPDSLNLVIFFVYLFLFFSLVTVGIVTLFVGLIEGIRELKNNKVQAFIYFFLTMILVIVAFISLSITVLVFPDTGIMNGP